MNAVTCQENPKLHLLHCGALRRSTPLQIIIGRSYRSGSFRVMPCARWRTPCVMTSLTGLLDCQTAADNESNHYNRSE